MKFYTPGALLENPRIKLQVFLVHGVPVLFLEDGVTMVDGVVSLTVNASVQEMVSIDARILVAREEAEE